MAVRIGGDEFVILFLDLAKDAELVSQMLRRIRAAIAAPVRLGGRTLRVTSSVGVATYPDDAADADLLVASADAAMYRAKRAGRDRL